MVPPSAPRKLQGLTMSTGTVKWFNPTKGYGFIQPQGGGQDVFVHISAVERAGLSTLNEGQQLEYEVVRAGSAGPHRKLKTLISNARRPATLRSSSIRMAASMNRAGLSIAFMRR